jgi:hypothetical protein
MRKLLVFCFVLLIHFSSSSQQVFDTDGLNNLNNVYLRALREYSAELDTSKVHTVYVKRDHFIGDIWPTEINGIKIKYLQTQADYINVIKRQGGNVIIVGLGPFGFANGKFYVAVIPFATSYKKRNIRMLNGGGLNVYFTYDQQNKGLVYEGKKWSGI